MWVGDFWAFFVPVSSPAACRRPLPPYQVRFCNWKFWYVTAL
ncbi:hypothetical protein SLEP1_g34358 [Rubroshorea leprosula]|uniref:Uncharacterized protein n=1 Tax=Rubroshorea leprosula TaxID=152421 RepID=A0AAV5KJV8_9ROSI|nr:hypothetical protein SLEP1_g34358 [Rubroshorea leprosula]